MLILSMICACQTGTTHLCSCVARWLPSNSHICTSWVAGPAADRIQHIARVASATKRGVFLDSYYSRLQSSLAGLMTTESGWFLQQQCMPILDLQWPSAFVVCPRSVLVDHRLYTHINLIYNNDSTMKHCSAECSFFSVTSINVANRVENKQVKSC